jgi:hypothetical protein
MTGGDTGEGDEGDVEFRNAGIPDQVRQFLGMDYASGVERLNNYSPAVHSTADPEPFSMTHNDKNFRVELNRIGQAPPATSCQNFWEIYGWVFSIETRRLLLRSLVLLGTT